MSRMSRMFCKYAKFQKNLLPTRENVDGKLMEVFFFLYDNKRLSRKESESST